MLLKLKLVRKYSFQIIKFDCSQILFSINSSLNKYDLNKTNCTKFMSSSKQAALTSMSTFEITKDDATARL